jgi:futalosine hydrolase
MKKEGILIVVAAKVEADAIMCQPGFQKADYEVLVTGVGGVNMAWALHKRLASGNLPMLAINAGIAGTYIPSLRIGDVVLAASDCFADLGIDDNGSFKTLFTAGLDSPDRFPFKNGRIYCSNEWYEKIKGAFYLADAATVNMASGSAESASRIKSEWNPAIETMEGAYFSYVCSMAGVSYLCLRAISNNVEPRNVKNWDIPGALKSLSEALRDVLEKIEEK